MAAKSISPRGSAISAWRSAARYQIPSADWGRSTRRPWCCAGSPPSRRPGRRPSRPVIQQNSSARRAAGHRAGKEVVVAAELSSRDRGGPDRPSARPPRRGPGRECSAAGRPARKLISPSSSVHGRTGSGGTTWRSGANNRTSRTRTPTRGCRCRAAAGRSPPLPAVELAVGGTGSGGLRRVLRLNRAASTTSGGASASATARATRRRPLEVVEPVDQVDGGPPVSG